MMTFQELEGYQRERRAVIWLPLTSIDLNDAVPLTPMGISPGFAVFGGIRDGRYMEIPIPMRELYPSLHAARYEIDRRISAARGNELPTTVTKEKQQNPSWPDAESQVRKAIKDLEDAPVSFDGDNPCVDKYRAILDAELRLLELRFNVELAEIGQADRDRIMSKLAE